MNAPRAFAVSLVLCFACIGCHVNHHGSGHNNNVEIGTPFGSMHVRTDEAANLAGLGITPYPGATPYHAKNDADSDSADVNMSFGSFHLGVKAVNFLSHDTPQQILDFYRKDLARYGEVITCDGKRAVGEPTRTAQGLTCDEDDEPKHGKTLIISGSETQLRSGSPQRQHIVAVKPEGDATKINLITLDLPGKDEKHKSAAEE